MQFGPEVCGDPDRAMTLEWLETNGLGGFASNRPDTDHGRVQ